MIILLHVLQDFTGISKQSIRQEKSSKESPYDAKFVAKLAEDSQLHGGAIGPDLSLIAKDRAITHLIESLLRPAR